MEGDWIDEVYGHIHSIDNGSFQDEYTTMYPDTARVEDGEAVKLRAVVKSLTCGLRRRPFRPWRWRERAKALLILGWSELAVGDAYKALLLVQAISINTWKHADAVRREIRREYPSTELTTIIRSLTDDIKMTLCECLFFANSFVECVHFLKWSHWSRRNADLSRLAEQAEADERKELGKNDVDLDGVEEAMRAGRISWTDYPFTAGDRAHRSAETMETLKECVERASDGHYTVGKSTIVRSPLSTQVPRDAPNDMYGIFAKRALRAGTQVFLETTVFSGCSEMDRCYGCCDELPAIPVRLECCDKSFCSISCARSVVQMIHHQDYSCSKALHDTEAHAKVFFRDFFGARRRLDEPFRQENDILETEMSHAKLLQKVLHAAGKEYQQKRFHPLECDFLKGLTDAKGARQAIKFSLEEDIVWPMNMLEQIGIDVFTTPDFDTWVIQTIKARLRANSWERTVGDILIEAISPLFSYFNHSCHPNAKWEHVGGGTTLKITLLRPITAGEEIFISYIGHKEVARLSKTEIKEKLAGWFENCFCSRCRSGEEDGGDQDLICLDARIRRHLSVSVAPAPAPAPAPAKAPPVKAPVKAKAPLPEPEPKPEPEQTRRSLLHVALLASGNLWTPSRAAPKRKRPQSTHLATQEEDSDDDYRSDNAGDDDSEDDEFVSREMTRSKRRRKVGPKLRW